MSRPVPPAPAPVVHLTMEFWPYARTGGLGEAVDGLAAHEHRTGRQVAVIMPYHRAARLFSGDFEPFGTPIQVQLGDRLESARLFRRPPTRDRPAVYLVEHAHYFDRDGIYGDGGDYPDNHRRFAHFARVAVAALPQLVERPPVLHVHDWHCALAPIYLRTFHGHEPWFQAVRTLLSVHNPGYQGHFGPDVIPEVGLPWALFNWRQLEWYGKANFLKGGIAFSDLVVTVSPRQAEELRTPDGGFGLHDVFRALGPRLVGILNGIDQQVWDPATDTHVASRYDAVHLEGKPRCKDALQRWAGLPRRKRVPLLGFSGRLVRQKGLDLILSSRLLLEREAQAIFLGVGDPGYADGLRQLSALSAGRIAAPLVFTDHLEHRLLSGVDILLMPSLYEPCGLTQMRAQRYGVLPIGRRVGGLADTIDDGQTGFLFDAFTTEAYDTALGRCLDAYEDRERWTAMMRTAMARDFSWERSAMAYRALYDQLAAQARLHG